MSASSPIVLVGTLDDIVFFGRNQAYGAFQLRRSYKQHLGTALALTVAATALLLLLPLVVRYFAPEIVVAAPIIPNDDFGRLTPVDIIERPVVVPPTARAAAPAVTVRPHSDIATEVVADKKITFTPKPTDLPQDNGLSGPTTSTSSGNPDGSSGHATASGKGGPGTDSAAPAVAAPSVVPTYVERMPEFAGGQDALRRYLQKHLRYPGAALANQIAGKVYLTFVVGADGAISEVTVIKDLGYGTGEAAARAVREMPAWTPGMQNRRSVPVRFTLPITFQYE